ncbi:MAG: hypothetical protein GOMPHAMPRED_008113 [Gomphillus americanus]|uniref:Uncharacterized protein n=1 Tax=Gomphillus americanus TaxID=1940652 RepID=A0A8H3EYL7_9LECA|nr:MAG: hypothetical protein GOMPHAMPRED_008113 [Gomphillus americanus]
MARPLPHRIDYPKPGYVQGISRPELLCFSVLDAARWRKPPGKQFQVDGNSLGLLAISELKDGTKAFFWYKSSCAPRVEIPLLDGDNLTYLRTLPTQLRNNASFIPLAKPAKRRAGIKQSVQRPGQSSKGNPSVAIPQTYVAHYYSLGGNESITKSRVLKLAKPRIFGFRR